MPGGDDEAVVEGGEEGAPALGGLFVGLDVGGEGGPDELGAAAGGEKAGEDGELPDVFDARKIADVVAEKLLVAEAVPAGGEAGGAAGEGLRETAESEEGLPVFFGERGGRADEGGRGEGGVEEFGDGEGMHAVGEVAAHEGVASALVDIHAGGAGGEDAATGLVLVEEAFEEELPAAVAVDFVECEERWGWDGVIESGEGCHGVLSGDDGGAVVVGIPVEIFVGECAGKRGFADLAGSGKKGHLAVFGEMFAEDGFVEAWTGGVHGGGRMEDVVGAVKKNPVYMPEWS